MCRCKEAGKINNALLDHNDSLRRDYSLPLLLCFSAFSVWNLSVMSFSGKTVWEAGGSGLYIHSMLAMAMSVAARVLMLLCMLFAPRAMTRLMRGFCVAAIVSGLALNVPMNPALVQAVFALHLFCQRSMAEICTFVAVYLLREKTAILHCTVAGAAALVLAAVFQNSVVMIPQFVFRLLMAALPALQLVFYYALPKDTKLRFVKKEDGLACPKRMFAGVYWLLFLSSILFLFGHAFAERSPHGILIFYISGAVAGLCTYALHRLGRVTVPRLVPILFAAGIFAFVVALVSEYLPVLAPFACGLFGISGTALALIYLFGITLAKQYPSRLLVPGFIIFELAASYTRLGLLTAFYFNHTLLNVAQLAIAVSAMVCYLVLQPYLRFGFQEHTAQTPQIAAPACEPNWRRALQANAYERLTEGELDVAGLIMRGYKNEEIAAETKYTLDTVKTYRKWLYSKLGVHSTKELFARAERVVEDVNAVH